MVDDRRRTLCAFVDIVRRYIYVKPGADGDRFARAHDLPHEPHPEVSDGEKRDYGATIWVRRRDNLDENLVSRRD